MVNIDVGYSKRKMSVIFHPKSLKWSYPPVLAVLIVIVLALFISIVLPLTGNAMLPWRAGAVALLLYIITVQVNGLFVKNWARYSLLSAICCIAILVLSLTLAHWLTKVPPIDLQGIKGTYALLVVFYILLTFLAGLFRIAHSILKGNEDH